MSENSRIGPTHLRSNGKNEETNRSVWEYLDCCVSGNCGRYQHAHMRLSDLTVALQLLAVISSNESVSSTFSCTLLTLYPFTYICTHLGCS